MHRNGLLWLAVVAGVVALGFQGSRGIYETTEGRYAEAAREMLETGNWLVPQLNYHPHWTKPPLAYWGMMVSMRMVGVNEWGVRLPNAAGFVLTALGIAWLGGMMWDRQTGLLGGFIYATSLLSPFAAAAVSTDVLLSLWQLLVVGAYWKAFGVVDNAHKRRTWILGMWLFAGLAFLTKGPPGLFSLIALGLFTLYLRRTGRSGPRILEPLGLLLFAVVGLGWYLVVIARTPGLLGYLIGDEVFGRVTTNEFKRHPEWYQPLVIYLPPLVFGLGAWVAYWPGIIRRFSDRLRYRQFKELLRGNPSLAFLTLWVGFSVAFFSLCQSRLPLYVLPCFSAFPLLTARALIRTREPRRLWRTAAIIIAVSAIALVSLKGVAAWRHDHKNMRPIYEACAAALTADTTVYAFEQPKFFGLQFYLKGRLKRISADPGAEWADASLSHFLDRVVHRPDHQRYLLVCRQGAEVVERALGEAGVKWRVQARPEDYTIYLIDASGQRAEEAS